MKLPGILIFMLYSAVHPEVDTSLIRVGNQWEYSQKYVTIPTSTVTGTYFATLISKKRNADSLIFEVRVRDSIWNVNEDLIRESTYRYVIVNGSLLIDSTRGFRTFWVNKPLFYCGGESGGATSEIAYGNDTLLLTRGTSEPAFEFQKVFTSDGSYLEKVGMIDMRTWWGGGMTSENAYFTLLRFNNENVDTGYIFSKEAVSLVRHERTAKRIGFHVNSGFFFNGKAYHANGKPALSGVPAGYSH